MDELDRAECDALSTRLRAQFTFPASVNPYVSHDTPALFCGIEGAGVFFPRLYTSVTVYGVADRSRQDAILEAVKNATWPGFKPIIIGFYERDLWTVHYGPDGLASERAPGWDSF
jgi:hypothetical protein